ncbi:MAG: PepSY domain-containing protein [Clostridium sp.]|nr:PepSY domain-containing protein [Clostridium sp.]
MIKRKILSLVMLLALSITACSPDNTNSTTTNTGAQDSGTLTATETITNTETNTSTDTNIDQGYADLKIKPEQAFDIFMEKYTGAKITKVQLDEDSGNYTYEVKGFVDNTEYEIDINSMDGTIIKEEMETDDQPDPEITRLQVEKVLALVDKALTDAGEGARLDEWTLEVEDGIAKLEVEYDRDGFDDEERTYNVETGELLELDD